MTTERPLEHPEKSPERPISGDFTCPCCNTTGLERDDFASASLYKDGWVDALAKKYGGPVCDYCADIENTPCEYCEAPIRRGDHCEECEAERVEAAAHEKSEKHGWEQV